MTGEPPVLPAGPTPPRGRPPGLNEGSVARGGCAPSPAIMLTANTVASLLSGVGQAGLFNPWDRALYLSVRDRTKFLSLTNFAHPYEGLGQALVQRTLSGGLYFFLQKELEVTLKPWCLDTFGAHRTSLAGFMVGTSAGLMNGAFLNQLAVIKYHTWGNNMTFAESARDLYKGGGARVFFKGIKVTSLRDSVFGATYEVIRSLLPRVRPGTDRHGRPTSSKLELGSFAMNAIAAGSATALSGPLNYVRTIQYGTPPDQPTPKVLPTLRGLAVETMEQGPGALQKLKFVQERLRMGWGTLRVAVGMAFGQYAMDYTRDFLLRQAGVDPEAGG